MLQQTDETNFLELQSDDSQVDTQQTTDSALQFHLLFMDEFGKLHELARLFKRTGGKQIFSPCAHLRVRLTRWQVMQSQMQVSSTEHGKYS